MKKFLQKWYPAIIILIGALILRLYFLIFVKADFNFDENFSLHFSTLPWRETLKYAIIETNPPLYTLILRFWSILFGQNEIISRLLSLIFGSCSILLIYELTYKFFCRRVAIFSTVIFSLSAINIYLNLEARCYSLLILLSILSSYLFLKFYQTNQFTKKQLNFYTLVQTCLLYTHLTALLIPLIQVFQTLNDDAFDKSKKKAISRANILAFGIFLIWFIPSTFFKLNNHLANSWYFNFVQNGPANFLNGLTNLLLRPDASILTYWPTIIIILIIFWLIIKAILKNQTIEKKILIYLLFLTLLPVILSSFLGILSAKYFCLSLPALALILAYGLNLFKKSTNLIIFFCLAIIMFYSSFGYFSEPIYGVQTVTNYIKNNETPNSLTIIMPFSEKIILDRYYHGKNPLIGAYPFTDNLTEDERIARYNWSKLPVTPEILDRWLTNITNKKDKIFYFAYQTENDLIINWLIKHNWQATHTLETTGKIQQYLTEFHAPTSTNKD